ncbi:hypothetical protein BH23ACT5_BH23ACT5_04360 [soil metagenome]
MAVVSLPRLLDQATGGVRKIEVGGDTLKSALDDLVRQIPELEVHLFDHVGALRPHVLCFVDGESTRLDDQSLAVKADTDVRFLQAASGG